MGIQVSIGGSVYEAASYSVSEDSTPTSSDDSSGSVGTLTFTFKGVENPYLLQGKEVSLIDTRRGTTVGFVNGVTEQDNGTSTVSCQSRLGRLNIYDVQAQPFSGNLRDAFTYYLSLAGQTTEILVDEQIALRPVVFPGWYGELWFYLKKLAAAQDCEIALVSNVILLRPLSVREAIDYREISRTRTYGGTSLARAVEVYHYDNHRIENEPVYPPNGWNPEVEVITVGAGETIERVLELSASVTYIQPPVMQTFVAQEYSGSSVYTIVGDDGLPIQPSQWTARGGSLSVRINQDTTSLTVTVTAPAEIRNTKGEPISTYSVGLGSDFTGNRYSTLRLIGTGTAFNKQALRIRTCIPDQLTGTDIGTTIDNPFISTLDEAYRAGVRAARWYAGERMVISGSVTSINQLGDSGSAKYPTYAYDQAQWQGKTYAQVQTAYTGKTYQQILDEYFDVVRNDFDNQVFGNAGGARVWDRKTNRWYRTRSNTIDTADISYDAEDDLKFSDVDNAYYGLTYAQERAIFSGLTYSERDRLGLKK